MTSEERSEGAPREPVEAGTQAAIAASAYAAGDDALILDLDGFEGPLDVLLTLARTQKVDLTRISILQLAEQYLSFIGRAREVKLEVAADYLVMAAWLAYMKSRLLLPEPEADEEPSGEEMAAALALRLRRLEAMRAAATRLMARPRLGTEVFARGAPEGVEIVRTPVFEAALYELLSSYAAHQARTQAETLRIEASEVYSMEDAYQRLAQMLGAMPDWEALGRFLPVGVHGLLWRSAVATTFAASLELAREGKLQLKQLEPFGPIYVRRYVRRNQAAP
jgi:segregation and condensation protein A